MSRIQVKDIAVTEEVTIQDAVDVVGAGGFGLYIGSNRGIGFGNRGFYGSRFGTGYRTFGNSGFGNRGGFGYSRYTPSYYGRTNNFYRGGFGHSNFGFNRGFGGGFGGGCR